jgi:hypothetical protein
MPRSCEHGNEISGSTKSVKILNQLSNHHLFRKDRELQNCLAIGLDSVRNILVVLIIIIIIIIIII